MNIIIWTLATRQIAASVAYIITYYYYSTKKQAYTRANNNNVLLYTQGLFTRNHPLPRRHLSSTPEPLAGTSACASVQQQHLQYPTCNTRLATPKSLLALHAGSKRTVMAR